MQKQSNTSDLIGTNPPKNVRPVSLALKRHLQKITQNSPNINHKIGIIFAVSGGADSLALAVAGSDQARRQNIPHQITIVNHNLRPEAGSESQQVRKQLRALGAGQVNILQAPKNSATTPPKAPETTARKIRHQLLEEHAQNWKNQAELTEIHILFGHTMEDQAETVLLRLARGASPTALAAMSPHRATDHPGIIQGRPLLNLRRADTEKFCTQLGLAWVEDPTNRPAGPWGTAAGTDLPRTAMRYRVLPQLSAALGQDVIPALARVANLAEQDSQALNQWAQQVFTQAWEAHENSLNLQETLSQPQAIRTRVYAEAWRNVRPRNAAALTAYQQLEIDALTPGKQAQLPQGWFATRKRNHLNFHPAQRQATTASSA